MVILDWWPFFILIWIVFYGNIWLATHCPLSTVPNTQSLRSSSALRSPFSILEFWNSTRFCLCWPLFIGISFNTFRLGIKWNWCKPMDIHGCDALMIGNFKVYYSLWHFHLTFWTVVWTVLFVCMIWGFRSVYTFRIQDTNTHSGASKLKGYFVFR